MTYIGNGPNFMVKSIAHDSGVHCPSFFRILASLSLPVLLQFWQSGLVVPDVIRRLQPLLVLAMVTLADAASAGGLVNLSARGLNAPVSRFSLPVLRFTGDTPKRVLVRGAGPALAGFGVTGALSARRWSSIAAHGARHELRLDRGSDAAAVPRPRGPSGRLPLCRAP